MTNAPAHTTGETMRAIVRTRYGGPETLELRHVPKPAPRDGEVLIRVRATAINDWDWGLLDGRPWPMRLFTGLTKPKREILGCDVAGSIESVGANVRALRVGDEVFGDLSESGFGAFADYVCAPERALARKPARMTFVEAAAFPHAGCLAWQGLIDRGELKGGQKILINGAGGGVGTLALQMAKHHGATVTVVDSAAKLDMLRSLGADHAIDYTREDFTKSARRYDLILDTKTNRSPWSYARALERGGIYATVGGAIPCLLQALILGPVIKRTTGKHIRIVALKTNKDLPALSDLFNAGKLTPVIDGPHTLADTAKAMHHFGAAKHKGKVVLTVD